jgi:uncharacterized membrane protein
MNAVTTLAPARPPSKRVEFIDLLRGWAVIVMIETHVFNATLTSETMSGSTFQWLKFINGLVAPSFLFASGLAYAITTHRKAKEYLSFGTALFRQCGRLLFILLVGYLLHLPKFKLSHLLYQTNEHDWQVFFQVDVLQCIAVSLLIMQLLLLILRTERRLYVSLIGICTVVVFSTPILWGIDFWGVLPVPIAAYLNGLHFSLFPLFPWSAFLFAGGITGFFYVQAKEKGSTGVHPGGESAIMRFLFWTALCIIVISFVFEPFAARTYPVYQYWRTSPSFFILRLGLVALLCVVMFSYEKWKGVSVASVVTLIGRESLLVYATHLLLIYGNFGTFNFRDEVRHTFGYLEAAIATVLLLLLMILLAKGWGSVKRYRPQWKRSIEIVTMAVFLTIFLVGPGN